MAVSSSSFFSDFGLLWYLEELNKDEFNKFKLLLKDETEEPGHQQIPWAEMKKAKRVDVANLMNKCYPGEQAWSVTFKILGKMGLKHLCEKAKAEMISIAQAVKPEDTTPMELEEEEKAMLGDGTDYKSQIKADLCIMRNKIHLPGQLQEFCHKITREDRELLEHLFDEDGQTGEQPQIVVLQGAAGTGKTTLVRKAMLEWAEGNLYQEKFAYAFYLNARDINQLKEASFVKLISKNWPSIEGSIEQIMSQPGRLLFIIDSFDELDFAFEEPESELSSNRNQEHPVSFLISSLLRKVMIPESSLLITTKPTAYKKLKSLLKRHRCVEIVGMSEDARREYMYQFYENPKWATQAFMSLRNNDIVFKMCQAHQLCWVFCTCLKQQMEKGADITLTCQTATSLFTCFLSSFLVPEDKSSPSVPNQFQLKNLCYLAAKGIWTLQYLFYREHFRKHGLYKPDVSIFVDMNILQVDSDYESCYMFIHLHVQEFFAAMFYVIKGHWKTTDIPYQSFEDLNQLLDSKDTHLMQMKCFLFGLVNEDIIKQLEKTFGCEMSRNLKWELLEWVETLENNEHSLSKLTFLELFHYLYETQYEAFTIQVMSYFRTINVAIRERLHLLVSSFCLKYCQPLQTIKLSATVIHKERPKSPDETWQAGQDDDDIRYWQDLCSVLHTSEHLKELDLFHSNLDGLATEILQQELRNPDCKLQRLRLRFVSFPDNCKSIFSSLTQNQNLTHLDLKGNNVGDNGVKFLCEDLKHPEHKLQNLSLEKCGLTVAGCEDLHSALIKNKRLKHLSLADNALGDGGVKIISNALTQSQSTLQSLVLMDCVLTSACCQDLAYVISNNSNLRNLDLGNNDLQDDGVKILCQALRHPSCNIQRLGLQACGLTSLCCQDLASTFSVNQRLLKINLTQNIFGYEGIKKLCEVLQSPECKLQTLGLSKEAFDEEAQKLLVAVVVSKPCLIIKSTFDEQDVEDGS
ncbi:NACHT, LRR and PYD domains-containing protein 14 [Rhynchocyon petersi]